MNNINYKSKHTKHQDVNRRYFDEKRYEKVYEKYGSVLTKKELSELLKISVSSINNYIVQGHSVPEYKKIGKGKNGRVLFPTEHVIDFISNTTKVF